MRHPKAAGPTHETLPVEGGARRSAPSDFIRALIAEDNATGKHGGRVATRFPPEPNGYLHIGHAKAICLNFGIAREHDGGTCNLRFDDTNPSSEDIKYAEAIQQDVRWLGFDWEDRLYFASDYFERLYEYAEQLIREGKAYVDSLSETEIREYRGTVTEPGKASPYRSRTVGENLDLFRRMRAGEFEDGAHVLRAKIDMSAANMLMRDPLLYRIRHAHHYRTGDHWCIYPMYDFAHCLSDAIEGITHSLCSLEFKDNRDLYDWVLEALHVDPRPEQTEFARLNLEYTVLSKRHLRKLVDEGLVEGWDDPRMPTIAGLRRRGVTPSAIRRFCDLIGVARVDSRVDIEKLEYCIRDDLNQQAPRVMCVLRPLRLVIVNYPEGQTEMLDAPYYPHDVPKEGSRQVPFSRELYIERDDFREDPPRKFFRLSPGREVRLRYAYYVTCVDVVKDPATGEVTEVHCTYDPATKGGDSPDGRKVKGTLHWVSRNAALPATVRLYDRLFGVANPDELVQAGELAKALNPQSLVTLTDSMIEPSVAADPPGTQYQFERQGYFVSDATESSPSAVVFNRTVELRDTWSKQQTDDRQPKVRRPQRAEQGAKSANLGDRTAEGSSGVSTKTSDPAAAGRAQRYVAELGLPEADAAVVAREEAVASLFEAAVSVSGNPRHVANWVVNDVLRETKGRPIGEAPFTGAELGALVKLVDQGSVSRNGAKLVFAEMARMGGDPASIAERLGLDTPTDTGSLEPIIDKLLAENQDKVAAFRAGRTGLLGFFVGQVMKASEGKADPKVVKERVGAKLADTR